LFSAKGDEGKITDNDADSIMLIGDAFGSDLRTTSVPRVKLAPNRTCDNHIMKTFHEFGTKFAISLEKGFIADWRNVLWKSIMGCTAEPPIMPIPFDEIGQVPGLELG
jgi:hypothetical protein